MKNAFSPAWKSSTQARKQRKYRANMPMHTRRALVSVHLSSDLREKHNVRALPVRVGDKVRVLRGSHKGKEGRVDRVDIKDLKVYVASVEHAKREGGASQYPLNPTNLLIVEIKSDKRRMKGADAAKSAKAAKKEVKK